MNSSHLSPRHKQMLLEESGINARLVVRRGYRTVTAKAELGRLGFSRSQQRVPALLIPVFSPVVERVEDAQLYQIRPDNPTKDKNGRPKKYLTPPNSRMALDVPPVKSCRERIADPATPLFITEGIKKADALASRSLCAAGMLSVWGWRGSNNRGGKTALSDWNYIALNDRNVYVVYDSDVMVNPAVYEALRQFKEFLEGREANVKLIYLPHREDGSKQGVDDFLASGYGVGDLLSLATEELRRPAAESLDGEEGMSFIPYHATPSGIVWEKPVKEGSIPTRLTNFTARITGDVAEDDGVEVRRSFEIEASLAGSRYTFTVPASRFATMSWTTEELGAGAIVYPGFGTKDHARAAVQLLSGQVPVRRVYSHTGWRKIAGQWFYLHGGGAIGPDGQVPGGGWSGSGQAAKPNLTTENTDRNGKNSEIGQVGQVIYTGGEAGCGEGATTPPAIETSAELSARTLPELEVADETLESYGEVMEHIRATLSLLEVAPMRLTFPLLAGVFRAVLGEPDFSIHLSGATGKGKTALTELFGMHFGEDLHGENLAEWKATDNFLEGLAFQVKDQVLIIDDFTPTGTTYEVQRWHSKADRVLRGAANRRGRGRMRPDGTLRPAKPPRALIFSTGEDIPKGQSLRARMLILEVEEGEIDFSALTAHQRKAHQGVLARTMAAFIRWLAPRYETFRQGRDAEFEVLREFATTGSAQEHRQTPEIVANLALGLRYFLLFACESGALSRSEAQDHFRVGWQTLKEIAAAQSSHQSSQEPTGRFQELLSAAIASGRAHVADEDGDKPENAVAWGWRKRQAGEEEEWLPLGERIGWVSDDDLYLEPTASFAAAQKQGQSSGDALTITERSLRKRLSERGLLLSTGKESERRQTLAVRVTLSGKRRMVLHLHKDFLLSPLEKPDQPDQKGQKPHTYGPQLWSGSAIKPDQTPRKPDHRPDQNLTTKPAKSGPEGTLLRLEGDHRSGSGQVPGSGWSGSGQVSPANLTTRNPDRYRETSSIGQVGQVMYTGGETNSAEGAATYITEPARLEEIRDTLSGVQTVALDTETTGLDPRRDRIRLIQLATESGVYVIDCFEVDPSPLLDVLNQKTLIAHNALFDLSMLAEGYGYEHRGQIFDTMVASQVLYAGATDGEGKRLSHSLEAVAQRELGRSMDKGEQTSDWSGELGPEMVSYAAEDARVLIELERALAGKLGEAALVESFSLEMRALPAMVWMSLAGVPVDEAGWRERAFYAAQETASLCCQLDELAGEREDGGRWNWNSWQHVIQAAKSRSIELPDTRDSTLSRYADSNELIATLKRYRERSKLASTYGSAWLDGKNGSGPLYRGRVYPSWRQIGAATGRMSCSAPNLQNVPPSLRDLIRPEKGRVLVAADYSQIELRIAARVAGEEKMIRAYRRGEDLHTLTARSITGKEEITPADRKLAKAVNFGLLYGMGVRGLAEYARLSYGVELTEEEAAAYRRAFFATYPGLKEWHAREGRNGREGETRTLGGRRRLQVSRFTDRLNTPVPGTGADGLKAALALLYERREEVEDAAPIMVVHDEVVIECRKEDAERARRWLERAMKDGMDRVLNREEPPIPVEVEGEARSSWKEGSS